MLSIVKLKIAKCFRRWVGLELHARIPTPRQPREAWQQCGWSTAALTNGAHNWRLGNTKRQLLTAQRSVRRDFQLRQVPLIRHLVAPTKMFINKATAAFDSHKGQQQRQQQQSLKWSTKNSCQIMDKRCFIINFYSSSNQSMTLGVAKGKNCFSLLFCPPFRLFARLNKPNSGQLSNAALNSRFAVLSVPLRFVGLICL